MITELQAILIIEAHDIIQMLENEEEVALLKQHNPELLEAYFALHRLAYGARNPNGKMLFDLAAQPEGKM